MDDHRAARDQHPRTITWTDDRRLEVDGVRFITDAATIGQADDSFVIVKHPGLLRKYLDLFEAERPRRMVELGINQGGSTALTALVAQLDMFLAIDLAPELPPILARLLDDRQLHDRVRTATGIDQGDRAALTSVVDATFPDHDIDLVVDDASHVLAPTRTSFEVLFPRLRPGGVFVVEDWGTEYMTARHLAEILPDAADFPDRLAFVNQVIHIVNAPDQDLPETVRAALAESAKSIMATRTERGDEASFALFGVIVEAAGRTEGHSLEGSAFHQSRPLTDLSVELMMMAAGSPEVIAEVRCSRDWILVRRGDGDLPVNDFRLDAAWTDFYGYLT